MSTQVWAIESKPPPGAPSAPSRKAPAAPQNLDGNRDVLTIALMVANFVVWLNVLLGI